METQGTQPAVHQIVEKNTERIGRLIHEVEKLVEILEEQRLVEPSALIPLKNELRAILRSEG